ncbi:TetR/AcrR family transcriptional regulator [Sphingobium fuliginis]|uniref:TetR/AcrR family transcriptional regulator n=1 Tax=Sphingobium fuliginis ATCC 27551 TaxID=1208342 RepID=A0A5B8CLZ5_SPHSA|nr:TetR/AcrR family transcriptional regulator [Sphingobium fuliginis]QDC39637.1 TetR/AcrR family transcriptional regulator [Sphingobium fuliginis ATCC 27551]
MDQTADVTAAPKTPRRRRGILRVEALLAAATEVFFEKGFEAATMTEIAERAGSSIGSLYQFFPAKESIADVLRARCGDAIVDRWDALRQTGEAHTPAELAEALFRTLAEARAAVPAFALLDAVRNTPGVNVAAVRTRIMASLNQLLRSRIPALSETELRSTAMVVLMMLRGGNGVQASNYAFDRSGAMADLRDLLTHYLAGKMAR